MKPRRIQLRRTKGWRKPANTVLVSRPSKWGNPIIVVPMPRLRGDYKWGRREPVRQQHQAVETFRHLFQVGESEPWATMRRDLPELRGKNLACWCKPGSPCHADILLELANQ